MKLSWSSHLLYHWCVPPLAYQWKIYLHALIFNCVNLLWSSMRIYFLWESLWILLICENLFYLWLLVTIGFSVYAPSGYSTRKQLARGCFFEEPQNFIQNKNERNKSKIILWDLNCTMDKIDRNGENKT